jgi:hypothetical protein
MNSTETKLLVIYLYNLLRSYEQKWQSNPTNIYLPKPWMNTR